MFKLYYKIIVIIVLNSTIAHFSSRNIVFFIQQFDNMYWKSQQKHNSNIAQQVNTSIQNGSFKIIDNLKFKNQLYSPGTNICLYSEKKYYGRILTIAKVDTLKFPVLLVAWYYSHNDISEEQIPIHQKELLVTEEQDWQYVQSLSNRILVISQDQFEKLDPLSRTEDIFFVRSQLNPYNGKTSKPFVSTNQCLCDYVHEPDDWGNKLCLCVECGSRFHPFCAKNQYLCFYCQ